MHETKEKKFACSNCESKFKTVTELNHHEKRIHCDTDDVVECHVCGKGFTRVEQMLVHKLSHSDPRDFIKCDICGKLYSCQMKLDKHQRLCHFKRPATLNNPVILSTLGSEDRIKCDICAKEMLKSSLRVHMKNHI